MSIKIRPLQNDDKKEWNSLYEAYADFYGVDQSQDMRDLVWSWIHDVSAQTDGLCAIRENKLIGIAHIREFARPLSAARGVFLDDLFVTPDARGIGAADALIEAVKEEAIKRDCTIVRWITADDNYRGRGVYDKVADRTHWITYDLKC